MIVKLKKKIWNLKLFIFLNLMFQAHKIHMILRIFFMVRIFYSICSFCCFTFLNVLIEYFSLLEAGEILGTSPSSSDTPEDGSKKKAPESRDSMVEKAQAKSNESFKTYSVLGSGVGSGTYEGINQKGEPCAAFAIELKVAGVKVLGNNNVSCGDKVKDVQDGIHKQFEAGLKKEVPSIIRTQDIEANYKEKK